MSSPLLYSYYYGKVVSNCAKPSAMRHSHKMQPRYTAATWRLCVTLTKCNHTTLQQHCVYASLSQNATTLHCSNMASMRHSHKMQPHYTAPTWRLSRMSSAFHSVFILLSYIPVSLSACGHPKITSSSSSFSFFILFRRYQFTVCKCWPSPPLPSI
jgi:hypothetical protein